MQCTCRWSKWWGLTTTCMLSDTTVGVPFSCSWAVQAGALVVPWGECDAARYCFQADD
jgi:hypothetical protein